MKGVTKTELVWKGKYDENGELRKVDRTILPFQVVETVNESKADREKAQRDLFTHAARDDKWRNMLIWGDNKVVMSSLLPRFAGKINLIYIDPPFATGADFNIKMKVGDAQWTKEASLIEEKAYRDTWMKYGPGRQLDSYLDMMYGRLVVMRDLLAQDGTIYVHLDQRVGHYVKAICDEVFGRDNFKNELIWCYRWYEHNRSYWNRKHDNILVYWKGEKAVFNWQSVASELEPASLKKFRYTDARGRKFCVRGRNVRGSPVRQMANLPLEAETKYPGLTYRQYEDEVVGVKPRDWFLVDILAQGNPEALGFPTQKPEALVERIIKASSNEGDLVADFFCGSGTTGAVAEKLGRRWIMCDLSKWAIQVTRKRLLQIEGCKPFEIMNLGNYERHKLAANGQWDRYVKFVLELYRAEPVNGFATLHGKKGRALVHVGSVDSPITMREIRQTLNEIGMPEGIRDKGEGIKTDDSSLNPHPAPFRVREVHFLGWDFEMGLHDVVQNVADDYGVKVRLVSIPRDALEVTNPAKEEVRFFDLNYLELKHEVRGRTVTVSISDFIIANQEYIPDDVRKKITKFSDYIDYWAIDWDYKDDTFHNGWQSFRTRKDPKLVTSASHVYDQSGQYKILVKVVDIFGNDTTKLVEVRV